MDNPRPTIEQQIEALAWLRNGWDGDNSERAITAFETLDNGDVFAALDQERNEREAAKAPRVPVAILQIGPLFQAREADGHVWATATSYKLVEEHLRELDVLFIVVTPDELATLAQSSRED